MRGVELAKKPQAVRTSGWSPRLSSSAAVCRAIQAQRSSGKVGSKVSSAAQASACSQSRARASSGDAVDLEAAVAGEASSRSFSASSAMRRQSRRRLPSASIRPATSAWPGIPSRRAPPVSDTRTATTGAPGTRRTRTVSPPPAPVIAAPLSPRPRRPRPRQRPAEHARPARGGASGRRPRAPARASGRQRGAQLAVEIVGVEQRQAASPAASACWCTRSWPNTQSAVAICAGPLQLLVARRLAQPASSSAAIRLASTRSGSTPGTSFGGDAELAGVEALRDVGGDPGAELPLVDQRCGGGGWCGRPPSRVASRRSTGWSGWSPAGAGQREQQPRATSPLRRSIRRSPAAESGAGGRSAGRGGGEPPAATPAEGRRHRVEGPVAEVAGHDQHRVVRAVEAAVEGGAARLGPVARGRRACPTPAGRRGGRGTGAPAPPSPERPTARCRTSRSLRGSPAARSPPARRRG